MEEVRRRRVAFGYGNLLCNNNCKPSLCKSSPPLSAIDRFLWGQTQSLSSHSQAAHQPPYSVQNNVKINKGTVLGSTADALLRGFSFHSDTIGGYLPRQTNFEESFLDGLFVDGEILALTEDKNPNTEMKASMKGDFPKGVVKRNKKVASAALIKGQWTDDEDRKLIRLVKQYGVRKWAQIAESLVGRAGNSVERGGIIICALISRLIEYLNPNNLLTFPLMYHKEELSHHAARAEVLQTLLFLHLVLGVEQGSGF